MAKKKAPANPLTWLLKAVASNPMIANKVFNTDEMVPPDEPYLDQFLNPQREVLPRQDLRPSSLSNPAALMWRQTSLPNALTALLHGGGTDYEPGERLLTWAEIERLRPGTIVNPIYPTSAENADSEGIVGMGHFAGSVGKDATGPYWSAYDKWDFDSPVVNPLVRMMLHRIGTPYHVYDRFDVTPGSAFDVPPGAEEAVVKLTRRKAKR